MKTMGMGLVVLVMGCASAQGTSGAASSCATPMGVYKLNLVATSGTCASTLNTVIAAPGGPTDAGANCTGSYTISDDKCSVIYDKFNCPEEGGLATEMTGKIAVDSSAKNGSGTLSITVRKAATADAGATQVCQGVYSVLMTQL